MTCSRIDLHHSRNAFSKHVTGLDQGDGEELVLGLLRVTKEVFLLSLAKLGGCLLQALLVVFVELRRTSSSALDRNWDKQAGLSCPLIGRSSLLKT